jgi:hypothetical protein
MIENARFELRLSQRLLQEAAEAADELEMPIAQLFRTATLQFLERHARRLRRQKEQAELTIGEGVG